MKAKITKGFNHLGRWINAGDEFDDEPAVIAALVDQGYAETEPGQPTPGQQQQQTQASQQGGLSSQGKPAQQPAQQQNQKSKHHEGRSEAQ